MHTFINTKIRINDEGIISYVSNIFKKGTNHTCASALCIEFYRNVPNLLEEAKIYL